MAKTTLADVEHLQTELEEHVAAWLYEHPDSDIKLHLDWASLADSRSKRKMRIKVEAITPVPRLPGFGDGEMDGAGRVVSGRFGNN